MAAGARGEALQVLEETEDELSRIIARVKLGARDVSPVSRAMYPPISTSRRRPPPCDGTDAASRSARIVCFVHSTM